MKKLKIFRIGGKLIDNPFELDKFLTSISALGDRKIIVHDAGLISNELAMRLGHLPVTGEDEIQECDTMQVMNMVYAGLMNKTIVSNLTAKGIQTLGVTGVDSACYVGRKAFSESGSGFTAEIEMKNVNINFLTGLIWDDYVPVLAPITSDEKGALLNLNADKLAAIIASALSIHFETELVICTEKDGVLSDPANSDSIINKIALKQVPGLMASRVISGRMIPKIQHAQVAIQNGVNKVVICNSNKIEDLLRELRPTGTTIHA